MMVLIAIYSSPYTPKVTRGYLAIIRERICFRVNGALIANIIEGCPPWIIVHILSILPRNFGVIGNK